jgi:hypothetical protein
MSALQLDAICSLIAPSRATAQLEVEVGKVVPVAMATSVVPSGSILIIPLSSTGLLFLALVYLTGRLTESGTFVTAMQMVRCCRANAVPVNLKLCLLFASRLQVILVRGPLAGDGIPNARDRCPFVYDNGLGESFQVVPLGAGLRERQCDHDVLALSAPSVTPYSCLSCACRYGP